MYDDGTGLEVTDDEAAAGEGTSLTAPPPNVSGNRYLGT